jgi:hypothetical protein
MLSLLKTLKILAVMRRTSAMGLLVAGILIPALEGRAAHIMSTPRSAMTSGVSGTKHGDSVGKYPESLGQRCARGHDPRA